MAKTPRWRRADRSAPEPGSGADGAGGTSYAERERRVSERAAQREAERTRDSDVVTEEPAPSPAPAADPALEPAPDEAGDHATTSAAYVPGAFSVRRLTGVLLLRAAHPRQAVLTAFGVAVAATFTDRPGRELILVFATVLVGQVVLGWFNDLVDRRRDLKHARTTKPVAMGTLDPGTLWFALAVAVLVLVPLSIGNGIDAGAAYLISVAVGLLGQWPALRRGFWSWLPWAVSFALYPAFLSYGGWGGQEHGSPPQVSMTVLAAVLGVGVHLLTALWGLVPDNEDGWSYLPLKLGLKIGASRVLWVALLWLLVAVVAIGYTGSHTGLSQ